MSFSRVLFAFLVGLPTVSLADTTNTPVYSVKTLRECVYWLVNAHKLTEDQAVLACRGTKDVRLIRDCVSVTQVLHSFSKDQSAAICSGMFDLKILRECIVHSQTLSNLSKDQAVVLCNQSTVK